MSSEEQPRRLMVQHVDDKVVTNNCMLFELTEMNDQDICAVDGRERSAWDQSPTHLKHTGVSPPRGRCHARAANTRPFSLGRRHARPESSKSCTEAEQAYMLSAPVRLGVRSQRTWWALHIGPVRRNRGQEFMVMSTWNDGTISAPAGTDRTRLTTVSVYMWFIVSGTALGVCHRRHHLRRHLHHHPHHLHQILRPLLRQNLRSTPHRQLRHRRLHQPHFRHPPSLLLVCAPCPAPVTPPPPHPTAQQGIVALAAIALLWPSEEAATSRAPNASAPPRLVPLFILVSLAPPARRALDGCWTLRLLRANGHDCSAVSPSLMPPSCPPQAHAPSLMWPVGADSAQAMPRRGIQCFRSWCQPLGLVCPIGRSIRIRSASSHFGRALYCARSRARARRGRS